MHELDAKKNNSGAAQPDHLLDELKSIKDLLAGERLPTSATAPTGERSVAAPQPTLLDIASIFADDAAPNAHHLEAVTPPAFQFPKFTLDVALTDELLETSIGPQHAAAQQTSVQLKNPLQGPASIDDNAANLRANYRREALIQELIAEFVPQIEAALRERLDRLDNAALQALKTPS